MRREKEGDMCECKCECCKKKRLEVPRTVWNYGGLGFISESERDRFYRWMFDITDIVNKLTKKKK